MSHLRWQRGDWNLSEEQRATRTSRYQQRNQAAVELELSWLTGECREPNWPDFPLEPVHTRPHFGKPGRREKQSRQRLREQEYVDHQCAALWLRNAANIVELAKRPWLLHVVRVYAPWTTATNGASLDDGEEVANTPSEWNDTYFDLLAHCLPGLTDVDIDELALKPVISLPDNAFFDVVTQFLRSVDAVYFDGKGIQDAEAIRIRSALARRLMTSRGWQRLGGSQSTSIEMHIGPAIAVLFLNDYHYVQPPKCYLLPKGVDRLGSLFPVLQEVIESGPCFFVAIVTFNLLEVSPKAAHLPFVIATANTFLENYPDNREFWIDLGIGRRFCALIDGVRQQEEALRDPDHPLRRMIDVLLAALVRLGLAEASRLETALASR